MEMNEIVYDMYNKDLGVYLHPSSRSVPFYTQNGFTGTVHVLPKVKF